MKNFIVKQMDINDKKEVERIYVENFPKVERVPFHKLFLEPFSDFKLYVFFNSADCILGFAHLIVNQDFVHINYLAVDKKYQRKGFGSKFIDWVKLEFGKPIVVDVELFCLYVLNVEERAKRLNFYYKNGFIDGDKEFDWAGTKMFYMSTCEIPVEKFMSHIVKCFPTISNIQPHESIKEQVDNFLNL